MDKLNVTSSFQGIWTSLYFFAIFFYSLSFSISKRSTLAKTWGGRLLLPQSPPSPGFYGLDEWQKCQPQSHIYTLYILINFLLLIIIYVLFSSFRYQIKKFCKLAFVFLFFSCLRKINRLFSCSILCFTTNN